MSRFTLEHISRMPAHIQAQVMDQLNPRSVMKDMLTHLVGPTKSKKMLARELLPTESQSQQALIKWWRLVCHSHGLDERILMAFPLGGKRTAITGAILKAEGARAGTPDLLLAVRRGVCGGLWIELKTMKKGSGLQQSQKEMLKLLSQDYVTVVCRSTQEAQAAILAYLRTP